LELCNIKVGERMNWNSIHFGKLKKDDIFKHIEDRRWQKLRVRLKGKSLEYKYQSLCDWLDINAYDESAQVQVTNYINALKRGGLIK
jgi:hypothetical protein